MWFFFMGHGSQTTWVLGLSEQSGSSPNFSPLDGICGMTGCRHQKKWTWNDGNPKRKWDTHNLRGWKLDIHMRTYVYIYICVYVYIYIHMCIYIMLCILHNNRNDPSFLCGGVDLHHTKSAKTNGASTGSNLVRAVTADGLQHLIGAPRQLRWTLLRTGKSCFEKAQYQVNIYIL